jgi:hypothetical protein
MAGTVMNQYIIDEEQLQSVERDDFSDQLFRDVRSHPYQSERDTVLDELDKMIMKRTDELLKEFRALQTPKSILVWERRLGVGEVLDMMAELRQQAGESK